MMDGMKRRSFLLVELLIAVVIMGAVFELLFLTYRNALIGKETLQYEKELVLGRHRLLRKFQLLFASVNSFKEKIPNNFLLKYQAAIEHDPHFRGELEGNLLIDKGRLLLISRAEKEHSRTEVLYEGVRTITFSFFDAQKGVFDATFPKTKPLMMKIELQLDNELLTLPVFL